MLIDISENELVQHSEASPGSTTQTAILLVEDDEANREVMVALLSLLGYQTYAVSDGESALVVLEEQDFKVLLTDIALPGMSGLQLAERIRALRGPKSEILIIALTGFSSVGDARRFLAAGIDGFLTKPTTADELEQTLIQSVAWEAPRTASRGIDRHTSLHQESRISNTFDLTNLQSIFGGDIERISQLLQRFSDNASREILNLCESAFARNAGASLDGAHRLKGSALSVGAGGIADCCSNLEGLLVLHDWKNVYRELRKLFEEQSSAAAFIEELRAKGGVPR